VSGLACLCSVVPRRPWAWRARVASGRSCLVAHRRRLLFLERRRFHRATSAASQFVSPIHRQDAFTPPPSRHTACSPRLPRPPPPTPRRRLCDRPASLVRSPQAGHHSALERSHRPECVATDPHRERGNHARQRLPHHRPRVARSCPFYPPRRILSGIGASPAQSLLPQALSRGSGILAPIHHTSAPRHCCWQLGKLHVLFYCPDSTFLCPVVRLSEHDCRQGSVRLPVTCQPLFA
jgi:hypothetical protein